MGRLDHVFGNPKRNALHVVRTYCEQCHNLFDDKFDPNDYSNHDAGRKSSTGMHLVQCPYCGFLNHQQEAHINDVILQGRFRDYAEEEFYGSKYGPLPPDPRFNQMLDKDPRKICTRDLRSIPFKPRKLA